MSDVAEGELELATLTRLNLFGRYLYRIGDMALSTPINLRAVGWSMLLIPTFWWLSNLGPLEPMTAMGSGLIPRLIIPGLIVWGIVTKLAHGARPWEVAWSYARLGWQMRPAPADLRPIVLTARSRRPTPPRRRTHHA